MGNVPMTNREGVLAVLEEQFGHSSTYVELENGDILHAAGMGFRTSRDGGLNWSKPFRSWDTNDVPVTVEGLVKLSGSGIGCASNGYCDKKGQRQGQGQLFFWRSEDNGKTWQPPEAVTVAGGAEHGGFGHYILQDVLLRTSSGRIILPCYISYGQKVVAGVQEGTWMGWPKGMGIPFPGSLLNNQFVSTSAHFHDTSFSAPTVFYSDDDGKTWQQTRSNYLVLNMEFGGPCASSNEPTVTEISPGYLLMFIRNGLGRLYQAWSHDDGETWTRPQPSSLAADRSPAQLRTMPGTNHLLCVWSQHNEDEIRRGLVRVRISSAISRTGGAVWEFFQNVESILEETWVPPGPIRFVRPENTYNVDGISAPVLDPKYVKSLPEGYGRWSYPSVLVHHDRVLIAHTYSTYDKRTRYTGGSRLKVLPIKWFYGDAEPTDEPNIKTVFGPAKP
tara:strand:- start:813 stop:2150 length:1338 start_codon:yes stop_codon:yes gene_type:complete